MTRANPPATDGRTPRVTCRHDAIAFGTHDSFRNVAVCFDCKTLIALPDLRDYDGAVILMLRMKP